MLKLDLHSLMREVEAAEDFRDQHLREWRRLIERYHGPAYRGGGWFNTRSTSTAPTSSPKGRSAASDS